MSGQARDADPIAAAASGLGAAAVAVIRLTGAGSHERLARCLELARAGAWPWQALRRAKLVDPETRVVLDEVLAVRFKAPRSYTGEDGAEIHCHGGPYVVRRILEALFRAGFRAADPGEFTRRAFLNGKLDLTEAEGIRELVSAESHQQWVAARQLATGKLKDTIEALRRELIGAMAFLEASIDFPDEGDTADVGRDDVRMRVAATRAVLDRLIASYDSGRVAARGLAVALFGEPNAGKSSLMNALLGRERALVTDIAGTTRDYLEEGCLVEGRLIRLIDMAGVRDASDPVERLGVEAAKRLAREADLVLFLGAADATADVTAKIAAWRAELGTRKDVSLLTKADLGRPAWAAGWPAVSTVTGEGLGELRKSLARAVDEHVSALAEESFVTAARHVEALRQARQGLDAFDAADRGGGYDEMLAFELQGAARALGAIVGEVGNEDVLDRIFREFCVGK